MCNGLHFCFSSLIYFSHASAGKVLRPITVKVCSENIQCVWKPGLCMRQNLRGWKDNVVGQDGKAEDKNFLFLPSISVLGFLDKVISVVKRRIFSISPV